VEIITCRNNVEAAELLHYCLEDGEVVPTRHFREELANEGIPFEDAVSVLRYGIIYDPPEENLKTGEMKYRIEGHEPGGKWMVIVFSFKTIERASLITIFSVQSRRRRS
jgi:uncharacterized DUF497 family protein